MATWTAQQRRDPTASSAERKIKVLGLIGPSVDMVASHALWFSGIKIVSIDRSTWFHVCLIVIIGA